MPGPHPCASVATRCPPTAEPNGLRPAHGAHLPGGLFKLGQQRELGNVALWSGDSAQHGSRGDTGGLPLTPEQTRKPPASNRHPGHGERGSAEQAGQDPGDPGDLGPGMHHHQGLPGTPFLPRSPGLGELPARRQRKPLCGAPDGPRTTLRAAPQSTKGPSFSGHWPLSPRPAQPWAPPQLARKGATSRFVSFFVSSSSFRRKMVGGPTGLQLWSHH